MLHCQQLTNNAYAIPMLIHMPLLYNSCRARLRLTHPIACKGTSKNVLQNYIMLNRFSTVHETDRQTDRQHFAVTSRYENEVNSVCTALFD